MTVRDNQTSATGKERRRAPMRPPTRPWRTAVLLLTMVPGGRAAGHATEAINPHGDPTRCTLCHRSIGDATSIHAFEGDVVSVCGGCHDGRRAMREAHPVSMVPRPETSARLPDDFPLDRGRVTCLTCHDVTGQCTLTPPAAVVPPSLLRGGSQGDRTAYCARCHGPEPLQRFNVHDQIQAGQLIPETCLWCHANPAAPHARRLRSPSREDLRMPSFGVCYNCHRVPKGHPLGHEHMGALPSAEMKAYMAAVEMQSTMHLPFEKLLQYARAAQRAPRAMPLDEEGRITCYTCHDPHEEGVVNAQGPGAGQTADGRRSPRLRAPEGSLCLSCHSR